MLVDEQDLVTTKKAKPGIGRVVFYKGLGTGERTVDR